ncbi:protein transport protein Sec23 [Tanacetum coccineum]
MSKRADILFPLLLSILNMPPSFDFCLGDLDRSRLILENTLGLGLQECLDLCLFSCSLVLTVLDSEYRDVPEHPSKQLGGDKIYNFYDVQLRTALWKLLFYGHLSRQNSAELAAQEERSATTLAACKTLTEELTEMRFPAPRNLAFIEGISQARYFVSRLSPAHKDPPSEQVSFTIIRCSAEST